MEDPMAEQELIKSDKELINWSHDYDSAAEQAARAGKPILLDFTAAPM
jgi:hypothetical protein